MSSQNNEDAHRQSVKKKMHTSPTQGACAKGVFDCLHGFCVSREPIECSLFEDMYVLGRVLRVV